MCLRAYWKIRPTLSGILFALRIFQTVSGIFPIRCKMPASERDWILRSHVHIWLVDRVPGLLTMPLHTPLAPRPLFKLYNPATDFPVCSSQYAVDGSDHVTAMFLDQLGDTRHQMAITFKRSQHVVIIVLVGHDNSFTLFRNHNPLSPESSSPPLFFADSASLRETTVSTVSLRRRVVINAVSYEKISHAKTPSTQRKETSQHNKYQTPVRRTTQNSPPIY